MSTTILDALEGLARALHSDSIAAGLGRRRGSSIIRALLTACEDLAKRQTELGELLGTTWQEDDGWSSPNRIDAWEQLRTVTVPRLREHWESLLAVTRDIAEEAVAATYTNKTRLDGLAGSLEHLSREVHELGEREHEVSLELERQNEVRKDGHNAHARWIRGVQDALQDSFRTVIKRIEQLEVAVTNLAHETPAPRELPPPPTDPEQARRRRHEANVDAWAQRLAAEPEPPPALDTEAGSEMAAPDSAALPICDVMAAAYTRVHGAQTDNPVSVTVHACPTHAGSLRAEGYVHDPELGVGRCGFVLDRPSARARAHELQAELAAEARAEREAAGRHDVWLTREEWARVGDVLTDWVWRDGDGRLFTRDGGTRPLTAEHVDAIDELSDAVRALLGGGE